MSICEAEASQVSMEYTHSYAANRLSFFFLLILFHGGGVGAVDGVRGSQVQFLPGFDGPLPFHLETGYVGVGEAENAQLFYYFVKSASDPHKDPLVLWLTGGPGCSSLSGFAYEIGPINFDEGDGGGLPKVTFNPYSWSEVANILFVELPVGTGFSYARTPEAAVSTGLQSCHQAYEFLRKWLRDYPEFISNPFYVGGDSSVGITIPVIVRLISDGNELGTKPQINLKGYLLGNPLTFPDEDNYRIPFAHGMGLISNELYKSLKRNCRGKYFEVNSSNVQCLRDVQTYKQLVAGLDTSNILESSCTFNSLGSSVSGERRVLDERQWEQYNNKHLSITKCRGASFGLAVIWANDPSVREALHVQPGTIQTWIRCNHSLPFTNYSWDAIPYHAFLSSRGYRSLIYSGDHDMIITTLSTQAWIKSLRYPIIDEWRQWRVLHQVAGYTRTYANNMTFASVKGAGHTAPSYNPLECLAMFQRWISYQPL